MNPQNEQEEFLGLSRREWFINHIGRLAGVFLGAICFAFVVFLAAIGFKPAFGIIVVVVVGVVLISLGGRLHGR